MSKLEDAAFGLSEAELQQIRYLEILKKRKEKPGKMFSDNLSVEAQIAMQQAREDMESDRQLREQNAAGKNEATDKNAQLSQAERDCETSKTFSENSSSSAAAAHPASRRKIPVRSPSESAPSDDSSGRRSHRISFSELYERRGSTRMPEDITDEDYSDDAGPLRQVLGGAGKLPNAMEIVEFVNYDDPVSRRQDDDAIDELARINSVEKCEVWMQATTWEGTERALDYEVFEQREHDIGWPSNQCRCDFPQRAYYTHYAYCLYPRYSLQKAWRACHVYNSMCVLYEQSSTVSIYIYVPAVCFEHS